MHIYVGTQQKAHYPFQTIPVRDPLSHHIAVRYLLFASKINISPMPALSDYGYDFEGLPTDGVWIK
jgi:hypothetical protein